MWMYRHQRINRARVKFGLSCIENNMKILAGISLLLLSISTSAQLGSWNIVNMKVNVNEKWSLFGEAQLRSLSFYNQFHYYEYKGGFQFKANEQLALVLGAGSYQTYAEGGNFVTPKRNDEFRFRNMSCCC